MLDTSDVPGGVISIVTGERDALATVLAQHDEVAAIWYVGSAAGSARVEKACAGNIKSSWVTGGPRDWSSAPQGQGREYLRRATQIKNIWIPYGMYMQRMGQAAPRRTVDAIMLTTSSILRYRRRKRVFPLPAGVRWSCAGIGRAADPVFARFGRRRVVVAAQASRPRAVAPHLRVGSARAR